MTRRIVSDDLKAQGIRMVKLGNKKQADVARGIGVSYNALNKWVRESELNLSTVTGEVKVLKDRIAEFETENLFLDKAIKYFFKGERTC